MKSHTYEIQARDWGAVLGWPVVMTLLLGGLVRVGSMVPGMPSPRPTLDVDRTVIVHQVDLSRDPAPAEIILIGDSSCLMNVDAGLLAELCGAETVNLGALSFLDLKAFARLLANKVSAQTEKPKTVVLLTHPDFVRKNSASRAHLEVFETYSKGTDHYYGLGAWWNPRRLLATHVIEGRFLSRVPTPLSGAFGEFYGFTNELLAYMDAHHGSTIDPRILDVGALRGSSDYRVASYHKRLAESVLEAVPDGSQLCLGLSPVPASFPAAGFDKAYARLLEQWAEEFPGSVPLAGLPATLEDDQFATKTHLVATARAAYTRRLAQLLKAL